MLELIDEIGKEHCKVIRILAMAEYNPDDARLPSNNVLV